MRREDRERCEAHVSALFAVYFPVATRSELLAATRVALSMLSEDRDADEPQQLQAPP
jgi:hypothetical protein